MFQVLGWFLFLDCLQFYRVSMYIGFQDDVFRDVEPCLMVSAVFDLSGIAALLHHLKDFTDILSVFFLVLRED